MSAEKALGKAKIGIMLNGSAFLSTLVLNLIHSFTDTEVPTAGTDGKRVIYNREFFLSLSPEERIGLVAHEAWHVALTHMTRRGHRDPELYNRAGDYVINQLLVDSNFEIPAGGCQNNKYRGMSTNAIYDTLLSKGEKPTPDNKDIIYASPDGKEDKEGNPTPGSMKDVDDHIQDILIKAHTQAKMQGDKPGAVPGEISRTIEDLINPVLPWESILQRFLTEQVKDDYNWTRPNKRFMPDFYLPTQNSEGLANITIAIDTSGSVSQEDLTKILSEITYIRDMYKPKEMVILDCDRRIHNTYIVSDTQDIMELEFKGGGGTSCFPVFNYIKENPTNALIYFTDLQMKYWEEEVDFPVLWIVYDNPNATPPIGEVTHYDIYAG